MSRLLYRTVKVSSENESYILHAFRHQQFVPLPSFFSICTHFGTQTRNLWKLQQPAGFQEIFGFILTFQLKRLSDIFISLSNIKNRYLTQGTFNLHIHILENIVKAFMRLESAPPLAEFNVQMYTVLLFIIYERQQNIDVKTQWRQCKMKSLNMSAPLRHDGGSWGQGLGVRSDCWLLPST